MQKGFEFLVGGSESVKKDVPLIDGHQRRLERTRIEEIPVINGERDRKNRRAACL